MYFFHDRLADYAELVFRSQDFTDAAEADAFFAIFAPGNTLHIEDRPFERFSDYQELLLRLMRADPVKYRRMHKGTPFYFMSWLAFDLHNYEQALFYIDAGISEDVRKDPNGWAGNPGAKFLLPEPGNQAAVRTVMRLRNLLTDELRRFNLISNVRPLEIDTTWRSFVNGLLVAPEQRTLISALYVFLLEFDDRLRELQLREGSLGGSNQPFTVHLFTGGLIFESLLKRCYPSNDSGQPNNTLGGILRTRQFLHDFSLPGALDAHAASLQEIHAAIQGSSSVETAFCTAARLRNTTGHNLVWDDVFAAPHQYVDLFRQIMNALLFVIAKKLA